MLGTVTQRFGFPLPAVFIGCLRRSQSVLKPAKQNGGQVPTMVLFEAHGLSLFRVIREGLAWIIHDFASEKRKGALKD